MDIIAKLCLGIGILDLIKRKTIMPNINDVMYILGEQNTQLDNLVGMVKEIKDNRVIDIRASSKAHDVIITKIDNHVSIDHTTKIRYMNWLETLRKYSLKAAGIFALVIILMAIPEGSRAEMFKILETIKNLFI